MEKQEKSFTDLHNIIGKTFGQWLVLEYLGNSRYKARCSCGTEMEKQALELMRLRSTKCFRCRKKEIRSQGLNKSFSRAPKSYYGDL